MVDQMLLELLCELGAEHLKVLGLLGSLSVDLYDLFVDVATEEMSSFSRVLLSLLNFFEDLANLAILALFDRSHLIHHVSEQVLNEQFCLFVTVHALVDLNSNHFTQLVRDLNLIVFETINLVADRVIDLSDFSTQVHFLLSPSHFFLSDPSINTADLCFQVCINRLDRLIFALELLSDVCIHLIVSLAHLLNTLSALFTLHALFQVHLVTNIINRSSSFFLLR